MSDWQQRVAEERDDLAMKLVKLRAYIEDEAVFRSLPEDDQDDLLEQLTHMEAYEAVLARRIGRFAEAAV